MRRINKRRPGPAGLVELAKRGETFSALSAGSANARLKVGVRQALLEDQRYLCCYCMRALDPDRHQIRIEHYRSQSGAPALSLAWANLLAACAGGPKLRTRAKDDRRTRAVPVVVQTCDYRKADSSISIDPQTKSVDSITYRADGQLRHPQPEAQRDIDERLNLNAEFLRQARAASWMALVRHLRKRLGSDRQWSADALARYAKRVGAASRLPPFFGMHEYFIRRWIDRRL